MKSGWNLTAFPLDVHVHKTEEQLSCSSVFALSCPCACPAICQHNGGYKRSLSIWYLLLLMGRRVPLKSRREVRSMFLIYFSLTR